jgi:uncharacterized Zn finger protein
LGPPVVNAVSYTSTGFEIVIVAPGLACPACKEALTPHSVVHDGATITVRCRACHTVAMQCEPCGMDEEACLLRLNPCRRTLAN